MQQRYYTIPIASLARILGQNCLILQLLAVLFASTMVEAKSSRHRESKSAKNLPSAWTKWWTNETSFDASLNLTSYHYFHNLPELDSNTLIATPQLKGKLKFTDSFNYQFDLRPRAQLKPSSPDEEFFLQLSKLFVEYRTFNTRIKLGWQSSKWGIMDGYSPMDVTNTFAYFEPLAPLRRGSLGISGKFNFGSTQIQALYIPKQSVPILPGPKSRWLPRDIVKNINYDDNQLILPENIRYEYLDAIELDHSLQDNFGFYMQWQGDVLELHGMYFEGTSPSPLLGAQFQSRTIPGSGSGLTLEATSAIRLIPIYNKKRTAGVALLWAISPWIIKTEIVYWTNISKWDKSETGIDIPSWGHPTSLGIERAFYLGDYAINAIFEAYTAKDSSRSDNQATSSYRIFDHAIAAGARLSPSEQSSLTFKIIENTDTNDHYYSLSGQTILKDRLKLKLVFDVFEGAKGTLIGTYTKNDRTQIQLETYW